MFASCQHKRRRSELTEGDAAKTFLMGPRRENYLGIFYILKIVIQAPCSSLQASFLGCIQQILFIWLVPSFVIFCCIIEQMVNKICRIRLQAHL